jgi:hypothetical protein
LDQSEGKKEMIEIELHDNTPAGPGEKHGPGPTHCGTVRVEYEYQAEMWVQDIETDYPHVVRVVAKDGSAQREWKRDERGSFKEVRS